MRHEFHPEAGLEFEEAVQFYKERGRKLGQRFAQGNPDHHREDRCHT